jgi:hypothetical protein
MANTDLPTARAASACLGHNVRRLRGEHTAAQLARHAEAWGLKWGTGRVAECEAGKVSATASTVYLLTLALSDLLGRSVLPSELFEGAPMLQSVVSNQPVQRPKPPDLTPWIEEHLATLPEPLQKAPVGPYRKTLAAMVEADVRIGKSLGLDRALAARWMAYRWGRPLSVERDERAAQQHSMTTVELIKDIEHGGYVTADGRWRVFRDLDATPAKYWWITGPGNPLGARRFGVPSLASAKEHIAEQLEAEAVEANRKRRGHITRELKAELQKVIGNGHD